MDFVNNLNAIVGDYIHLFNQQIGQLRGQHIRCRNRVNDLLSAALAGLFFSLQLCLGGDSSIGIFDFQYFCVISCLLRFICVQIDLPQEIPFKESLLALHRKYWEVKNERDKYLRFYQDEKKATHHLSQRLKEVEAENSQLYAMKRDFRRVWNYFGAEKMQQVIGLMRGQEQTADKSQKKNRQNSVEL